MSSMPAKTGCSSLLDQLDDLIQLRPFPETAQRLMQACDKPDVTAGQISEIIRHDPTLAVSLLQIANSSLYGFSGEILSVEHASVVLGLRALKNLALSVTMGDVFGNGGAMTEQARQRLWNHAIACGSIARTLSASTGMAVADEAFFAGVVHDIGKLLLVDHQPEDYIPVLNSAATCSTIGWEQEQFGLPHTSVGSRCSQSWGLPDEITDVILFHHTPQDADFGGDLIDVVSAANQLAKIWDPGESSPATVDSTSILIAAGIDLSPDDTTQLQHQAVEELSAVRQVYRAS